MSLSTAFCSGLSQETRIPADLDHRLTQLYASVRGQYTEVHLDEDSFARHLGRHLSADGDVGAYLDGVRGAEMFLACACAEGNTSAMARFEAEYLDEADRVSRRLRLTEAEADELKQRVRHELFVTSPGQTPVIAKFAGRGPLRGWLRIVAVRTGQRIFRENKRELPSDAVDEMRRTHAPSPEHDVLKRRYQAAIVSAVREAVSDLTAKDRELLQQYFADGLTPREIGEARAVHRTTVGRWIDGIRATLLAGAKRRLMERLEVDRQDLDGVLEFVQTRFDVTLSGLFRPND